MMDELLLREQFISALRQLWSRGLIVGSDGMLCCEAHRRRYLVTPVGKRRADLSPEDLICVDIGGENVLGGEGVLPELWQPHRDVYQTHMNESGMTLKASAIVESVDVMALMNMQEMGDPLDLGSESIPIVNGKDAGAMRAALAESTEAVLCGRGLFVAGEDLPSLLNRIERICHAVSIRLALGPS